MSESTNEDSKHSSASPAIEEKGVPANGGNGEGLEAEAELGWKRQIFSLLRARNVQQVQPFQLVFSTYRRALEEGRSLKSRNYQLEQQMMMAGVRRRAPSIGAAGGSSGGLVAGGSSDGDEGGSIRRALEDKVRRADILPLHMNKGGHGLALTHRQTHTLTQIRTEAYV